MLGESALAGLPKPRPSMGLAYETYGVFFPGVKVGVYDHICQSHGWDIWKRASGCLCEFNEGISRLDRVNVAAGQGLGVPLYL